MTSVGFLPPGYAPEVERVRDGEMSFAILESRKARGLHETTSLTSRIACPWCGHTIYKVYECYLGTFCETCDGQVLLEGHHPFDPTPVRATRGTRLPTMVCVEDKNGDTAFNDVAWQAMTPMPPCIIGRACIEPVLCLPCLSPATSAWRRCDR